MPKANLYKFKHRRSDIVFYGHGETPRIASIDLIAILFKRPFSLSPTFIKERYQHLVDAGLITPPARPSYHQEDWDITMICAGINNNAHLAIVNEIQTYASPNAKILNVPKVLRRTTLR